MAVTIHNSPQSYTPSDNPVTWRFSSNQTLQVNFSFFIEVYVNGILTGDHLVFPEDGIYAHFDAWEDASIACNKPIIGSSFETTAGNNAEIYIKVYERYGNPATNQASATSSTVTVFKACLSDSDWIDFTASDYIYSSGSNWLTLFPSTEQYTCGISESQYIMAITNSQAGLFLEIELFAEGGGAPIFTDSSAVVAHKITILKVDPTALIAETSLILANFQAAAYYEVYLDIGGAPTEKFRIYIDQMSCNKYTQKRFQFLSSIGSVESFTYSLASAQTRNVKKMSMEKQFGQWNDSNEFVYDLQEGREQDFITTSTGKMTVTSDWITELVQNWLVRELYESPFVLMQYGSTSVKVKVLNSSYKLGQYETDGLLQEVIELGLSDNRKSMII